jgi:hypothetical protein
MAGRSPSRTNSRGRSRPRLESVREAALAAAVVFEATEDDPDELPGVLAVVAAPAGREPDTQGGGETFEVLDAGFVQTVGGKIHARAAS